MSLAKFASNATIAGSPIPGANGQPTRLAVPNSEQQSGFTPGLPVVAQYLNELLALERDRQRDAVMRALSSTAEARDTAGSSGWGASSAGVESPGGTARYGTSTLCDGPDGPFGLAGGNLPCVVPGPTAIAALETVRKITVGAQIGGSALANAIVAKRLVDCVALLGVNALDSAGIWQWSYSTNLTAGFTGRLNVGAIAAGKGAWLIPGRVVNESGTLRQKCLAFVDGNNGFRRDTALDTWIGIGIPGATSWSWTNCVNIVGANDGGSVWAICKRKTDGTSEFWRSTDDGQTWALHATFGVTDTSNLECDMMYDASQGGFVLAIGGAVYSSPDGLTWSFSRSFVNFRAACFLGGMLFGTIKRLLDPYGGHAYDTIAVSLRPMSSVGADYAPRSTGIAGRWVKSTGARIFVGNASNIRMSQRVTPLHPMYWDAQDTE